MAVRLQRAARLARTAGHADEGNVFIYQLQPPRRGAPSQRPQDPSVLAPAPGARYGVSWCRLQCQDLAFSILHPEGHNTSQPELYLGII